MKLMTKPSSTQIGAIAENLVANTLMLGSNGRLSPFSPVADDDGIDMLIYDKTTGCALPAQVKSRTVALKKRGSAQRGNIVHFEVRAATFRSDRHACVVLVLLSEDCTTIERAWVVPMRELAQHAAARSTKYVVRASKSLRSRDRFSRFQCKDAPAMVDRILGLLQNAPPTADQ